MIVGDWLAIHAAPQQPPAQLQSPRVAQGARHERVLCGLGFGIGVFCGGGQDEALVLHRLKQHFVVGEDFGAQRADLEPWHDSKVNVAAVLSRPNERHRVIVGVERGGAGAHVDELERAHVFQLMMMMIIMID